MLKHTGRGFVLVALLIAGCLWALRDYDDPNLGLKKGIDLQGGTELVYQINLDLVRPESRATILDDVKAVITNRFDAFGLKEINIATAGRDQLIIQLPGFDNQELQRMKKQIERSGELSFHLYGPDQTEGTLDAIEAEWLEYYAKLEVYNRGDSSEAPIEPERMVAIPRDANIDPAARVVLLQGPLQSVSGDFLQSAAGTIDEYGAPAIRFDLSGRGAADFGEMTGNNVGQMLCIVLDGTMIQKARIDERIDGRGRITGSFSQEEVNDIVTLLRAGSLPAKPELVNEQTIGALLGRDSIERGTQAMMIGFTIVIIFMLFYYLAAGAVADVALFLNLLFLLAMMQVFRNTLTFPGMAGLLLTVGMAVDANILIFARIREEKARGRGLAQAVHAGFQRAFWTIFDANVTTLITAYILFKFGSGAVKGFAVVLAIGIVASFFTSLYVSRLILTVLIRRGVVKELKMMSLLTGTKIDFMSKRKVMATVSLVCVITGALFLVVRGTETLGIDFTGGARLIASLQTPTAENDVRTMVSEITDESGARIFQDVQVQTMGVSDDSGGERMGTQFSIRTRHLETDASGRANTDQFRARVEEVLTARSLLAPEGFTDIATTEDPPTFTATVNFIDESGTLTSRELETQLQEVGFPVTGVQLVENGSTGTNLRSFVVTAAPNEEISLVLLESNLTTRVQEDLKETLSLSTPFPEVNSIGGRVAEDMQGRVFVAMIIAFFAIVFYISLRFRFQFGLAAIVALVHDILFVLGTLAICDLLLGNFISLKINLPVIAALLTTVGYSLNDTIVIFDRIRENLEGKKRDVDYTEIVNTSINQTLSRTVLTSVTTFVVVLILFLLGGEGLAAFSFALCVGVVVGTYSSIFVASPALIHFHRRSVERREEMLAAAAAK